MSFSSLEDPDTLLGHGRPCCFPVMPYFLMSSCLVQAEVINSFLRLMLSYIEHIFFLRSLSYLIHALFQKLKNAYM
jgi:hypothetical protein